MNQTTSIEIKNGEQVTVRIDSCGNTIWSKDKTDVIVAKNRLWKYLCFYYKRLRNLSEHYGALTNRYYCYHLLPS